MTAQTLILRDYRTPGRPLEALPVKIPADRLGCSRSALGRALLLQALDQLETTTAQQGQGVA